MKTTTIYSRISTVAKKALVGAAFSTALCILPPKPYAQEKPVAAEAKKTDKKEEPKKDEKKVENKTDDKAVSNVKVEVVVLNDKQAEALREWQGNAIASRPCNKDNCRPEDLKVIDTMFTEMEKKAPGIIESWSLLLSNKPECKNMAIRVVAPEKGLGGQTEFPTYPEIPEAANGLNGIANCSSINAAPEPTAKPSTPVKRVRVKTGTGRSAKPKAPAAKPAAKPAKPVDAPKVKPAEETKML